MTATVIIARRDVRACELVQAEGEAAIRMAQSIRYRAHLAAGATGVSIDGRYSDPLDRHAMARVYLLCVGRRTIGTIRVGLGRVSPALGAPCGAVAAMEWFGSEIREAIGPGARVLEAAHLAVEPSADDTFLYAHDRLLRAALAAAMANEADALILAVPRRHSVFYRRQWRMRRISAPRRAYGLQVELCLMALTDGREGLERLYAERPWLQPRDEEIELLAIRA